MALAMTRKHLLENILACLTDRARNGLKPIGACAIASKLGEKRPTVNRDLARLVSSGVVLREGAGPATSYRFFSPDRPACDGLPQAAHDSTNPIRWRPALALNPLSPPAAPTRFSGASGS